MSSDGGAPVSTFQMESGGGEGVILASGEGERSKPSGGGDEVTGWGGGEGGASGTGTGDDVAVTGGSNRDPYAI